MAEKTLENLFHEFLKDAYYVERRLLRTLPKMAKGSDCQELAAILDAHHDRTESQLRRLEQVFALLGKAPAEKIFPVIDGIIDEGLEILQHYKASPALGAGILAAVQAVAHYEMSRYGALRRWAGILGMPEAAALLGATLDEEARVSAQLDALADQGASAPAMAMPAPQAIPALQLLSEAA